MLKRNELKKVLKMEQALANVRCTSTLEDRRNRILKLATEAVQACEDLQGWDTPACVGCIWRPVCLEVHAEKDSAP